ncbi:hypothetical protein [Xenorhabdus innexi]|uniref:hypothetical protein n=1 Tax=Xenorhabdus innexi TaxID=290109 RepID=UPI001C96B2DB|nr:hypothetical protein [Xenorhabdus innexi]
MREQETANFSLWRDNCLQWFVLNRNQFLECSGYNVVFPAQDYAVAAVDLIFHRRLNSVLNDVINHLSISGVIQINDSVDGSAVNPGFVVEADEITD